MGYVLISVLCSVTVSIILKLGRRYSVNTTQMVIWNYPAAIVLSWFFLRPDLTGFSPALAPLGNYAALGLLLPAIFLAIAASIRYTGIVRTEIAQRISLIIPLTAAFLLFNETPQAVKLAGVALGLIAVICSINWKNGKSRRAGSRNKWIYPLLVFAGMGAIDILFKQVAQHRATDYTVSVFIVFLTAAAVSFTLLAYLLLIRKQRFSVSGMFWGFALGTFNFGNILFYMRAHRALPENPSLVFSAMNIGVILLGTLAGVVLFSEKLSALNKAGLAAAIIAVIIIAFL